MSDPFNASEICDVCGRHASDCNCRECPKCGTAGDPACWVEHGLGRGGGSMGMAYNRGFLAGKRRQPNEAPYGEGGSVNRQRMKAWYRGWKRATEGKPLLDYNG